jgi:hypothetical protein
MNTSKWGARARSHAQTITNTSPGRGSATRGEAQAAEYVSAQLTKLGYTDVRRQAFEGLRSIWIFSSLAFGIALVGHAAFWLLREPLGEITTLIISILAFISSAYLLWRKFTFRDYPLRTSLPHGPSQNVIAVRAPAEEVHHRLVLVGHLDSHRAVLWFAYDFTVKLYTLISPVAIYGIYLSPVMYALAVITGIPAFAWLVFPLTLTHFLAWFTGVTADLGPYSPGANDNASAVGTLLAFAERLQKEPLKHTEVWLAFTGCEETGCDGMINLLEEYGATLKEALFIDFELVGIGERLVYLRSEGMVRRRKIPPEVEKLVCEASEELQIKPFDAANIGVFTEIGAVWEYGLDGVCVLMQRMDSPLMPEWHRLTDTADNLQAESLTFAHQFAWDLMQKFDAT